AAAKPAAALAAIPPSADLNHGCVGSVANLAAFAELYGPDGANSSPFARPRLRRPRHAVGGAALRGNAVCQRAPAVLGAAADRQADAAAARRHSGGLEHRNDVLSARAAGGVRLRASADPG